MIDCIVVKKYQILYTEFVATNNKSGNGSGVSKNITKWERRPRSKATMEVILAR